MLQAFGEKDSVVNGALHQLGKHVAEVSYINYNTIGLYV